MQNTRQPVGNVSQFASPPADRTTTNNPSIATNENTTRASNCLVSRCNPLQDAPSTNELQLVQWEEWDESHQYNETPPKYILYSIEWKLSGKKKNKRTVARETEQNIVLGPSDYWTHFLHSKIRRAMKRQFPAEQQPNIDDTCVTVAVNDRSERDVVKQFDGLRIDWDVVESQLRSWGEHFRVGRNLRVDIEFNHVVRNDLAGASGGVTKRGRVSATQRQLSQRDDQLEADRIAGRPSHRRDVHEMMRCPGPPCHLGPYCWRDTKQKKHYKLMTHQLKRLDELYALEQQRLERQSRVTLSRSDQVPPIHITNVLPQAAAMTSGQQEPGATVSMAWHADSVRTQPISRIIIPGMRDERVREYCCWQQSFVADDAHKAQYAKAGEILLARGWDLELMYRHHQPDMLIQEGIWDGVAADRTYTSKARANTESCEEYTDVSLSHAHLYTFADRYDVEGLRELALYKLHQTLVKFTQFNERIGDVSELLCYAYDNTPERLGCQERLRDLVLRYVACHIERAHKDPQYRQRLQQQRVASLAIV
ncbi:hypothetical protein LTS09_018011 [Friedmanniomyces endolithicus]|nr:hypothetical protein LTS09_018011 [Friedmanniomyces endolithicus]